MEWFRWYHGACSDSKWPLIAKKSGQTVGAVVAVWAALLEHASQGATRGGLDGFDCEEIDALYGWADGACAAVLRAMTDKGMIVEGRIRSWEKRQPLREDATAALRKRRQREREAAARAAGAEEAGAVSRPVTQGHAPDQIRTDQNREQERIYSASAGAAAAHPLPTPSPDGEGPEAEAPAVLSAFPLPATACAAAGNATPEALPDAQSVTRPVAGSEARPAPCPVPRPADSPAVTPAPAPCLASPAASPARIASAPAASRPGPASHGAAAAVAPRPSTGCAASPLPETPVYRTKKGRALSGGRLRSFERFWRDFAYPKGKAEAADAWLDIAGFDEALAERICAAARQEAAGRAALESRGQTPKWGQGWLNARRWEDYAPAAPRPAVGSGPAVTGVLSLADIPDPTEEDLERARRNARLFRDRLRGQREARP